MKYLAALLIVCTNCSFATGDFEEVTEKAVGEVMQAGVEALEVEVSEFEVRIEEDQDEDVKRYYRHDQVVLVRRLDIPVYRLCKNGVGFGNVVVNKDYSPHILLEQKLDFSIFLVALEDGAWELTAYGTEPDFLEVFIVTSESVQPVDPERYKEVWAQGKASRAYFKSVGDSMSENIDCPDETEGE